MILGWKRPGKVGSRGFLSIWPHGQEVKTSPFHGGNPSSILGGVTIKRAALQSAALFLTDLARFADPMKKACSDAGLIQHKYAVMAELADAQDLGSCGRPRAGSIPVDRTRAGPSGPFVMLRRYIPQKNI